MCFKDDNDQSKILKFNHIKARYHHYMITTYLQTAQPFIHENKFPNP